ncbi:MAG: DUF424 domain-containing protein [Candidatus Wukongarchaeota archaeon]|nr:DUF424 family protein [Candidatus Wukongarchaeota archaeon]
MFLVWIAIIMEQDIMVFVKIHKGSDKEAVIAACDADILGETFSDDEKGLCLRISESFYGGNLVSIEKAVEMIQNATNVNLVGKNIVRETVEAGLASPEAIITIGKKGREVPHLLILRL